jgi:DNA-binding LytR/AlgR family response regulator
MNPTTRITGRAAMKALIIQDDAGAAREIGRLLAELAPELEALAPLTSVREAAAWLAANPNPELIVLDIELADGQSFELFEALTISAPVLFTARHDVHAFHAMRQCGADYLLKPVAPDALAVALAKFRSRALAPPSPQLARHYRKSARRHLRRFLIPGVDCYEAIEIEHVAYFAKALAVRLITVQGRSHPLKASLEELEAQLDPSLFFRVNDELIAHIQSVLQAHSLFKGRLELELDPPLAAGHVVVEPERAAALRKWLER